MYKNILVPVALETEKAGDKAIAVAQTLLSPGGVITLLHVVEDIQGYVAAQLPADISAQSRAYANAGLDALARRAGVEVHTKLVGGHSARTILDEAEAMKADCIVIASHRPGLEDYFMGSTAARVVRHARCSVHVIR